MGAGCGDNVAILTLLDFLIAFDVINDTLLRLLWELGESGILLCSSSSFLQDSPSQVREIQSMASLAKSDICIFNYHK